MYRILLSNKAIKDLDDIPAKDFTRISNKILVLKENPRPIGCMKLTNSESFRIRSGKYRIIYAIEDNIRTINIYRISHRKDSYK